MDPALPVLQGVDDDDDDVELMQVLQHMNGITPPPGLLDNSDDEAESTRASSHAAHGTPGRHALGDDVIPHGQADTQVSGQTEGGLAEQLRRLADGSDDDVEVGAANQSTETTQVCAVV